MLEIEGLTIAAHGRMLIENLSLDLEEGKIACLIGPSGCGKTSVVKWLAGILPEGLEATGRLAISGRPAARPDPAIGYQPQGDALFPWLNVRENAALGLEVAGMPRAMAQASSSACRAAFSSADTGWENG